MNNLIEINFKTKINTSNQIKDNPLFEAINVYFDFNAPSKCFRLLMENEWNNQLRSFGNIVYSHAQLNEVISHYKSRGFKLTQGETEIDSFNAKGFCACLFLDFSWN